LVKSLLLWDTLFAASSGVGFALSAYRFDASGDSEAATAAAIAAVLIPLIAFGRSFAAYNERRPENPDHWIDPPGEGQPC
jgi:hypothetical protein